MTFKKRYIEEGLQGAWDKTKEMASNNPGIVGGITGAGLGAAANYFGDGAESMEQDRTQDLENFREKGVAQHMVNKEVGAKDDFTDLRDAKSYLGGRNGINGANWLGGRIEDLGLFKNDNDYTLDVQNYQDAHPDATIGDSVPNGLGGLLKADDSFDLNGHKVQLGNGSDAAWDDYKFDVGQKYRNLSAENIDKAIASDKGLTATQGDLQDNIGDSTTDSYRNKILGGAALGAGGTYASRKLKERQG